MPMAEPDSILQMPFWLRLPSHIAPAERNIIRLGIRL